MTLNDLIPFLNGGMIVCALMAIVYAFRYRSRGISAFIMCAAFLMLAFDMWLLRQEASQDALYVGAAALVGLLIWEFIARSAFVAKRDARR